MGGDPHFTVRLPSGQLLCYSVQGEPGSIFNLISSKDLEINALFIPQRKQTKTWLGVIGVVVNGRKLIFNVTSGTIQMDDSMKMEANLVEKIKLTSGKFYLTMMTGSARARHVEVDLAEYDVRFLIVFVGRQHLDLVWFSGGIEDKGSFHGLIGKGRKKMTDAFHSMCVIKNDCILVLTQASSCALVCGWKGLDSTCPKATTQWPCIRGDSLDFSVETFPISTTAASGVGPRKALGIRGWGLSRDRTGTT